MLLFSVAVTVAVWSLEIVPGVAGNFSVVRPDVTGTLAGTVSAPALLDSPTDVPPVPAALDRVAVQVEVAPVPRLVGLHVSPLTTVAAASEMFVVLVLLFSVAVTVAVWSFESYRLWPGSVARTSTRSHRHLAGTCQRPPLLDSPTAVPPAPAAFDNVTVQVEVAPVPRLVGLHVSPLTTVAAASEMFVVRVLLFSVAVTVAV